MPRIHRTAFLILLLAAVPALAQSVAPGERVRVTSLGSRGEYEFVRLTADSLTVRQDGAHAPFSIAASNVSLLEVSRGGGSRWGAFGRGAGIGLLVGGVVGYVGGKSSGDDKPGQFMAQTANQKATELGVILGILGAGVGGVIGAVGHKEHWQAVPLR